MSLGQLALFALPIVDLASPGPRNPVLPVGVKEGSAAKSLEDFNLSARTDELVWSLVHVVLIFLCIVLLIRTASGLKNARFLRHVAWSYGMTGVFYFGNAVTIGLQYIVSLTALSHPSSVSQQAADAQALASVEQIGRAWSVVDTALSLASSFWLLIVWDLLRNYPQQGVSRDWYAKLIGIFGGAFGVLFALAQAKDADLQVLVTVSDVGLAAVCIAMVGWQMQRVLKPQRFAGAFTGVTFVAFLAWALMQIPYAVMPIIGQEPLPNWYNVTLMILKLGCAMFAIILSSLSLPENPDYTSGPIEAQSP